MPDIHPKIRHQFNILTELYTFVIYIADVFFFIQIRDGYSIDAPLKATITGNKDHTTIISTGQALFIQLYSWELNLARVEFEAHYSVFENGKKITYKLRITI